MSDSPETSPSQSPPQTSSSDADSAGQPSAPPSPPKSPPPASASAPPPESVSSTPPPSKPSSPPPSPPAENNPPPSESSTPTTEQQNNPPTSSSSTSQEKPSPSSSSPQSSSPSPTTSTSSSSPKSQTNSASAPQQSSPAAPKAAPGQQSPQTPTGSPRSPPFIIAPTNSSSSISQGTPGLTPLSTSMKAPSPTAGHTTQTSKNSEQDGKRYGAAVGATVGFVCLVAFVVLICAARRRKKRREQFYIPQQNQTVQSDAYHPGAQQGTGVHSGSSESGYYSSQIYNSSCSGGSQSGPNNFPGGPIESTVFGGSKAYFSYEELMEITGGFSRQNILGEGGFGCVYKGWLLDGKAVAVKQLKAGSGQGDREFKAEVEIISRVHHRHLVSLVGYCISEQHRLLIYEFVPNKTLEHHLHGGGTAVLEWTKRVKIALGSAKGLAYLHEDCHPKIIHRDIKSANILLDDAFEAQVADFGLARLNDTSQTHVSTRVMGTFGYLAPEYAASGKLTDRSDVFSFGVVLLELITGRKPVDPNQPLGDESLVEWARPHLINAIESGGFSELADPRLAKQYVEREMLRMIEVAAACVRHSAAKRPRMAQVVRALDMEGEVSDLSNGVKFGQSTAYDSGQYSEDIMRFRQLALGSDTSSEYNMNSGGYSSHGFTNSDSETRAINPTYRESS